MATIQKKENAILLKGSAKIVTDYLFFGINSILFQRGIYPPEKFEQQEHFGLTIYVSTDEEIKTFINAILTQLKDWLLQEKVQKLSLVVNNRNTKEVLERWDFKLQYEKPNEKADSENVSASANSANKPPNSEENKEKEKIGNKDIKVIQQEIRDVLRQICSTVSFLPLLDAPCVFDCLAYTKEDTSVPDNWKETEPVFIANSQEVQLRSFSTSLHKMDTVVSYKHDE